VKNVSGDVTVFSGKNEDGIPSVPINATLGLSGNAPVGGGDGIQFAGTNMVHSYITFPGISMHPEIVTGYGVDHEHLAVSGQKTHPDAIVSEDVLTRNVIRVHHDMFLVKAGLAYVDDSGTFCLYDINDDMFEPDGTLPTASAADAGGKLVYRVEGIKAVRFVQETDADGRVTGVNIYVLAEGDNAVTGRTDTSVAVNEVGDREFPPGSPLAGQKIWSDITWNNEMYYEDFEMRWRTRNIEAPIS
jgi:hypothetical protein